MSVEAQGRPPEDLVEGPIAEPPAEYIEEATTPSAEAWEHEREARKEQEEAES